MKQKIYTLGVLTSIIVVAGSLMKMFHFPGAGMTLMAGIAMLLLVFLPAALISHYRNGDNRARKGLYIVTWLTCFVVFTSMLFKVLHWPYAGVALMVALPFPYVVFLPFFLAVTKRDTGTSIHDTVSVLFLLAGVSVFSALLSLNVSRQRIDDKLIMTGTLQKYNEALVRAGLPADAASFPGIAAAEQHDEPAQ